MGGHKSSLELLRWNSREKAILAFRMSLRRTFFLLAFLCADPLLQLSAQVPETQSQAPQTPHTQGAVSTGGAHAAILDAEHRPITAGGFVDKGPVIFEDVTAKSGLGSWQHVMGTPEKKFIIETVGSGVALLDYDNDG